MPGVLVSTGAYLQQLAAAVTQDNDSLAVPDLLLQEIDSASENVVKELEGGLKCTIPFTSKTNSEARMQLLI